MRLMILLVPSVKFPQYGTCRILLSKVYSIFNPTRLSQAGLCPEIAVALKQMRFVGPRRSESQRGVLAC